MTKSMMSGAVSLLLLLPYLNNTSFTISLGAPMIRASLTATKFLYSTDGRRDLRPHEE